MPACPRRWRPRREERALAVEALVEVDTILHGLPAKARTALLLCRLEGLSYREIAQRLNVSVSSVEKYVAAGAGLLPGDAWPTRARNLEPRGLPGPLDPAVVRRAAEMDGEALVGRGQQATVIASRTA